MVNFEWYRSFVAVYQIGTVTGAAASLYLTQPAVSQHLASLEVSLGVTLFNRQPRKMIPTDEGKTLYARIIGSINQLESATSDYHKEKTQTRSVIRVGSPAEFFQYKVLELLSFNKAVFRVHFDTTDRLIEDLANRKLDIVFATKKDTGNKIVEYQKLFNENFILVQSATSQSTLKQYTDSSNHPPSEALLLEQPWLSYDNDLPIIRRFWRKTFNARPAIVPTLIIPNLSIILNAIEKDKGISVLPDYICQESIAQGTLSVVDGFQTSVSNDIWLAYRKEELHHSTIRQIIGYIRNELSY